MLDALERRFNPSSGKTEFVERLSVASLEKSEWQTANGRSLKAS